MKNKDILREVPYQREVSYFSMDDEYQNLYLNDLIIKITFDNNNENLELFDLLKENLKLLKVKIKNNKNYYEIINSLNLKGQTIFKGYLIKSSKIFYGNLSKLIPNLQFSLMSLDEVINYTTNKYI